MSDLIELVRYASGAAKLWGHQVEAIIIGEAADQIEAQQAKIARLREAATEAEKMFRWYGDLHAAKPDPDKAARNYEMADKMAAALEQKP